MEEEQRMGYTIDVRQTPDPEEIRMVGEGLYAYNNQHAPPGDFKRLGVFLRDAEGTLIGGLTGGTYWGYLYVGRLWTEDRFRKVGLGGRLLAEAEQEAQRRGCHSVHLMTGSFNAMPFYQKRGYLIFGELQDMPIGHTQYFMYKNMKREV